MANIRQLAWGHWQVQIRLKGRKATETFLRHDHACEWASEAESQTIADGVIVLRHGRTKTVAFGIHVLPLSSRLSRADFCSSRTRAPSRPLATGVPSREACSTLARAVAQPIDEESDHTLGAAGSGIMG